MRSVPPGPLVATISSATARRAEGRPSARRRLRLIEGSISPRQLGRQAPLLAALHRMAGGALAGLGLSLLGLSALTIHWQNQWARSYVELEAAKSLEHRMQESAALLEQHHLAAVRRPGQLVPTSSEKLIHLPEPGPLPAAGPVAALTTLKLQQLPARLRQIPAGY